MTGDVLKEPFAGPSSRYLGSPRRSRVPLGSNIVRSSFWTLFARHFHQSGRKLTIFMQLFSSKVEEVSVAISWATISTAWLSRWCFLTKASLARTAAPAPSEVGLRRESRHVVRETDVSAETDDRCLRLSPTLQQSEVLKHLPGVNHLLQTVLILELGVSAREERRFSSTHHEETQGFLAGMLSYGLLVECLWFFQAILAKCSGLVPERGPTRTFRQEKKAASVPWNQAVFTIFLHVFSAGVAEHLGSGRSSSHPVAVDHHLHVLVHGVGPVHKLG